MKPCREGVTCLPFRTANKIVGKSAHEYPGALRGWGEVQGQATIMACCALFMTYEDCINAAPLKRGQHDRSELAEASLCRLRTGCHHHNGVLLPSSSYNTASATAWRHSTIFRLNADTRPGTPSCGILPSTVRSPDRPTSSFSVLSIVTG